MAPHQSSATINLFRPLAYGGVRSTTTWMARGGRFFPSKGRRQGATTSLRLCRSHHDDEGRLWTLHLRPEDLIEPSGKGIEEMKAIWDALVREPLQPVWLAIQDIIATRGNLFRCRCFHPSVLSGPLLLVASLCKFYTVAPNFFMTIVPGYIFYKLSVLSAHLSRNGKANDMCTGLQGVLISVIGIFHRPSNPKDLYYSFTHFLWTINFHVYACTLYCELADIKYPRQELEGICLEILTRFKGLLTIIENLITG